MPYQISNIPPSVTELKAAIAQAIRAANHRGLQLGITNQFIEIEVEGQPYLLRRNGKLHPPYKREHELRALEQVGKLGIDTAVLSQSDDWQLGICHRRHPISKPFTQMVYSNHREGIAMTAFYLAKIHGSYADNGATYPLAAMIKGALSRVQHEQQQASETLKGLEDIAYSVLAMLYRNTSPWELTFCHNDLLESSVYLHNERQIVIVDWEYSGLGPWSTDLAQLTMKLPLRAATELSHHYFRYRKFDCLSTASYEFQLSRYLQLLLQLLWQMKKQTGPLSLSERVKDLQSCLQQAVTVKSPLKHYSRLLYQTTTKKAPKNKTSDCRKIMLAKHQRSP